MQIALEKALAKKGVTYEQNFDRGQENRNDGIRTGGEAVGVYQQESGGQGALAGGQSEIRQSVGAGYAENLRQVTPAELGIRGGSDSRTVGVLDTAQLTGEARAAAEQVQQLGLEPVAYQGDLVINGQSVNGYLENGKVYFRTDARYSDGTAVSPQSIAMHETFHNAAQHSPGLVERGMAAVRQLRTEAEVQAMKDAYRETYKSLYNFETMTEAQIEAMIEEELVADAYGKMNYFRDGADVQQAVQAALPQGMGQQTTETAQDTRGPPQAAIAFAEESGEAAEEKSITSKLRNSIPQIKDMESAGELTGSEFPKGALTLVEQVGAFFRRYGNKVTRNNFGDVILDERGVKDDIAHGLGRAKAATFAAVPQVIANGQQIDFQENWKGRGKNSYVFAAPVTIGNQKTYVAAVVLQGESNHFYLHEVLDENGNRIYKIEEASAAFKTSYSSQSERTGAAEASKSIISNTEGKSKTENGGWASTEVKNNQTGQITIDSTEEQRYEILKDMTIEPAEVDYDKLEDVEFKSLNGAQKSDAKKAIKSLARKLGINKVDLQNSKISFPFRFSNGNAEVSAQHQSDYGGTYDDLAKALTCMPDLVNNAVLIETHEDKKTGTKRANKDLKQVYVLFSAMREEKNIQAGKGIHRETFITPVLLEVKENYTADNGLYLTVALSKINESEVVSKASAGKAAGTPSLFSDSEVSIRELIGNVNVKDGRFLKYAPDGFLSDEQRVAKQRALQRQAGEYAAYTIDGKGSLTIEGDIGVSHESTDRDNADTMDDATKAMMWEYMKRHGYDKKFRYSRHLYRDYVEKHGLQSPRSDAQTDDGFSPDTFPARSDSATAHAAREIQRERGTEEAIDYVAEQFVAGRISSDEAYQIWQELRAGEPNLDELLDTEQFAPLKDYDENVRVIGKFSENQYQVQLDPPVIAGTRVHFEDNLANRPDRSELTADVAQDIIDNNKLILYQTNRQTLKFLASDGYAVINLSNELITVVPEKLRKKYRRYLEEK